MNVGIGVGMAVVNAVMGRPPKNRFLSGALGQPGEHQLIETIEFKRAVAEIAVVSGGDSEHAKGVCRQEEPDIRPAEGDEKDPERAEMEGGEAEYRSELIVLQRLTHDVPCPRVAKTETHCAQSVWSD